jgi:GrpB-like predicted nucleotidyltransferase (UPF0157 family)
MIKKDLHQLSTEELGKLFPIIIEKHNPEWPIIYQKEKSLIEKLPGSEVIERISHIGSTAIEGIMAKPTIDILIEVAENFNKDEFIQSFKLIDYQYIPQPENPPPNIMFTKGYSPNGFKGQAFHIHVRYKAVWDEILFRDYLIAHPKIAKKYEALKLELAKKHKYNREDYTDAKTKFIQEVMNKVK